MAKQLGAELQGLARCKGTLGKGMKDRTAVTQATHATAVEQVRIYAGNLGGRIWAHAQGSARELIHQLERLKVQLGARSTQQGLQMLKKRGNDQLIAKGASTVQKQAPEFLDLSGL
jgi:hypothetical protein